jgi:hypothetical protein
MSNFSLFLTLTAGKGIGSLIPSDLTNNLWAIILLTVDFLLSVLIIAIALYSAEDIFAGTRRAETVSVFIIALLDTIRSVISAYLVSDILLLSNNTNRRLAELNQIFLQNWMVKYLSFSNTSLRYLYGYYY